VPSFLCSSQRLILFYFVVCMYLHAAAWKGHADVVKLLMERGADRLHKDHKGKTALDRARESKHSAVVALLEAAPITPAAARPGVSVALCNPPDSLSRFQSPSSALCFCNISCLHGVA
jgi:hypothetical protein